MAIMLPKFQYKLIVRISALILLANLLLPGLALGQEFVGPVEGPITPQTFAQAQTSQAECQTFRNVVWNTSNQQAKAIWWSGTAYVTNPQRCFIVPGTFHDADGINGDPSGIPEQYKNIEAQIKAGSQIPAQTWIVSQSQFSSDQQDASGLSRFVGTAINNMFSVVTAFLASIAALAGLIFSYVVEIILNVTSLPSVVDVGWKVIRDIANMFFILALIVISLGTILRLKEYQEYGHLIRELVFMAILVNFSKVIALTIMNAVNFIAAIFYSNGLGSDVFSMLMSIANPVNDYATIVQGGWMGGLVLGIGKLIFTLVATVVFIALAGMFVIRLVGLYVLIIFSPIAYVARILPATEKFSEEWWSHFFKYLIWAPVALFMIRLTVVVTQGRETFLGSDDTSFYYFIIIAFLVAALLVAEEAGMVGSKAVISAVEKGAHAAGHWAMGYSGRKINNWSSQLLAKDHEGNEPGLFKKSLAAVINPVGAYKGWAAITHEQRESAQEEAHAGFRETFEKGRTGYTRPYREIHARSQEMEKAKEYANMDVDTKKEEAKKLAAGKGHLAEVSRRALLRAAAEDGELEDLALAMGKTDSEGRVTNEKVGEFMREYLDSANDHESVRFIQQDMTTIGKAKGRFDYTGHSGVVADTDEARQQEMKKQEDYQNSQIGKLEEQKKAMLHPSNYGAVLKDLGGGNAEYVYGSNKAAVEQLTPQLRTQMNRMQGRFNRIFVPGDKIVLESGVPVIEVDRSDQADAITRFWDHNTDQAKAEVAKKMGVKNPQDQINKVPGIRVKIKEQRDAAGNITRAAQYVTRGQYQRVQYDPEEKELSNPLRDTTPPPHPIP